MGAAKGARQEEAPKAAHAGGAGRRDAQGFQAKGRQAQKAFPSAAHDALSFRPADEQEQPGCGGVIRAVQAPSSASASATRALKGSTRTRRSSWCSTTSSCFSWRKRGFRRATLETELATASPSPSTTGAAPEKKGWDYRFVFRVLDLCSGMSVAFGYSSRSEKEAFDEAYEMLKKMDPGVKEISLDKYYSSRKVLRLFGRETKVYVIPKRNLARIGLEWSRVLRRIAHDLSPT